MREMDFLAFFLLCFLPSLSSVAVSNKVGVCYGQLGNNLPSPPQSVQLIKNLQAKRVKIYGADPGILGALKGTDLQVSIMVPNEIINDMSSNQTLADDWVRTNVVPFYPDAKIRYLLVGNEILSLPDKTKWFNLVPAMRKVKYSVRKFRLHKIKVGTPLAMDVLQSSFPPSNGTFRSDISDEVMRPMLEFLNWTKSYFFLDVYTFFAWIPDPTHINLNYALLEDTNITYTDPISGLTYTNLLDQMLDAVVFAMKRIGYPDIRLFVAETGWPNGGDVDQIGANIYNAATYNRNVVKKLTSKPPAGTPLRPGVAPPAFIFALYNENQKPGPGTERHFGLLYPNGTNIYDIDLSGRTPESEFRPLPKPRNNEPYRGNVWCVIGRKANVTEVSSAMEYACGQGNGTCDPIKPGGSCYSPKSLLRHANYAFSSYWAQFKKSGGSCYFNGLTRQTARDPSYGSCKFPSVTL